MAGWRSSAQRPLEHDRVDEGEGDRGRGKSKAEEWKGVLLRLSVECLPKISLIKDASRTNDSPLGAQVFESRGCSKVLPGHERMFSGRSNQ